MIEEVKYSGVFNLREKWPQLPRQKVNDIRQYKMTKHFICTLSYGYVTTCAFGGEGKDDTVLNAKRVHRGNISSATFAQDFQYFITASGSFSRNHDNSIVVSKCIYAQNLFLKNEQTFPNAHGKYKGVMSVKSSNSVDDALMVSCGNEDDSRIVIWDISTREIVQEIRSDKKKAFYYINTIVLDMVRFHLDYLEY